MTPSERIRTVLGDVRGTIWSEQPAYEFEPEESLSPFPSSKTYVIPGETGQFDFPSLPDGSYCLYDANEQRAVRLWRKGHEIEAVLHQNWPALPQCDPVVLAQLLLDIVDGGLSSHSVLRNAAELTSWRADEDFFAGDYLLSESELAGVRHRIGSTTLARENKAIVVRAITLYGWMDDKSNLGIEQLRIEPSGRLQRMKRETLSRKIFSQTPDVLY